MKHWIYYKGGQMGIWIVFILFTLALLIYVGAWHIKDMERKLILVERRMERSLGLLEEKIWNDNEITTEILKCHSSDLRRLR